MRTLNHTLYNTIDNMILIIRLNTHVYTIHTHIYINTYIHRHIINQHKIIPTNYVKYQGVNFNNKLKSR